VRFSFRTAAGGESISGVSKSVSAAARRIPSGWIERLPTSCAAGSHRVSAGYTNAHVARRRQLEPLVATGQVACCRCDQLIEPGQPWHLDHRDDRRGYLGAAHAVCNLRAAAHKRNSMRKDTAADLVTGLVRAYPVKRRSQQRCRLTPLFKPGAGPVPRSPISLPDDDPGAL
jgi:hypothetical protein